MSDGHIYSSNNVKVSCCLCMHICGRMSCSVIGTSTANHNYKRSSRCNNGAINRDVIFSTITVSLILLMVLLGTDTRRWWRQKRYSNNAPDLAHLRSTKEVIIAEISPTMCSKIYHKESAVVLVLEASNVLMGSNDIGNMNHFFKDDFYPMAAMLVNHFNRSACLLMGDFFEATSDDLIRQASNDTPLTTRSFFMRSLLSQVCREQWLLATVGGESKVHLAATCQYSVQRTGVHPPIERYPLTRCAMERKISTFRALRKGAWNVVFGDQPPKQLVVLDPQSQSQKRVITVLVYSRADAVNSRVLLNAESVVDDLRVLLRCPSSDERAEEQTADPNEEDSVDDDDTDVNENDDNDDNDDNEDSVLYDIQLVPSLLTMTNTQRIQLFSRAHVVLAPHGAWIVNTIFMPDNSLVLTIEKDENMVSFNAWDRFFELPSLKVPYRPTPPLPPR